jgi:hypothetical protein
MPLLMAAHCDAVNPELFSSYSKRHAVPLYLYRSTFAICVGVLVDVGTFTKA